MTRSPQQAPPSRRDGGAPSVLADDEHQSPYAIVPTLGDPAGVNTQFELFRHPVDVLLARRTCDVRRVLDATEQAAKRGLRAIGFVSYEAAPAFDQALAVPQAPAAPMPLVWFALFEQGEVVTLAPSDNSVPAVEDAYDGRATYFAAVATIRAAIARGDVYQVNHTVRRNVTLRGSAVALFARLFAAQPSPHAMYIDTGDHQIVSASPELFISRTGSRVVMRPMKGTAPRGRWQEEDDANAAALAASAKECAENLMIVDLVRSDLGRIAQIGSVRVDGLLELERYPTVWQLTSTVSATVPASTTMYDLFAATFPCGSVTGAPKVAAMRYIAALEPSARGVYCGAIGRVLPGGDAHFNVGIRTVCIDARSGRAEYGVGGGITYDSTASAEYDEIQAKTAVLTADAPVFSLIETLRLEPGGYQRFDRHLMRLADSACYFGFRGAHLVAEALLSHARDRANTSGTWRVRALLDRDGSAHVESAPYRSGPARTLRVTLARSPVLRSDPFLYHKTTRRQQYSAHRSAHPNADAVLFWNEDRELTEFTIGNLVLELDGARWTPPRASGLLAGVFRAELLSLGQVQERVVHIDDVVRATRVWMVNSVREWVPVTLE